MLDDVVIVIVEEQAGVHELVLNDAAAPEGSPEVEKVTACEEPDVSERLAVALVELPWLTLAELGLTEIEKSKGVATITGVPCRKDNGMDPHTWWGGVNAWDSA